MTTLKESDEKTMAAIASEYAELKRNIEIMEKKCKELRAILEEYLLTQPDNSAEIEGWLCTLAKCEREIFSLSKAKLKLDGRILRPFISKTEYSSLRVTYKGKV